MQFALIKRTAQQRSTQGSSERGFTVFELITVMAIATILSSVAIMNLRDFDDPLVNGSAQFVSFLKQTRAEALRSTSAYIIRPSSANSLVTERGVTCLDEDAVDDPRVRLTLSPGATFSDVEWEFCFNSRGMPDSNIEIQLQDAGGAVRTVEVLLGGSVRIQ
jgi:prepilin-type N-terminal cleavage/methylation domain-containing protein